MPRIRGILCITYITPSPYGYSLFEKRESFIKKKPSQVLRRLLSIDN